MLAKASIHRAELANVKYPGPTVDAGLRQHDERLLANKVQNKRVQGLRPCPPEAFLFLLSLAPHCAITTRMSKDPVALNSQGMQALQRGDAKAAALAFAAAVKADPAAAILHYNLANAHALARL